MSDVAPTLIITADHDPLRDEGDEYAAKLKAANVAVDHTCWPAMIYGQAFGSRRVRRWQRSYRPVGVVLCYAFDEPFDSQLQQIGRLNLAAYFMEALRSYHLNFL